MGSPEEHQEVAAADNGPKDEELHGDQETNTRTPPLVVAPSAGDDTQLRGEQADDSTPPHTTEATTADKEDGNDGGGATEGVVAAASSEVDGVVAAVKEPDTATAPSADGPEEGEEGAASPSHSQPSSTHEMTNSAQQAENDGSTTDEQMDVSELLQQASEHSGPLGLSSHIEIHPSNEVLGSISGSSRQKFIKRPLNAYMIWTRQERKRILTGDPKLKMNEVSKAMQMGEKWKAMSDAQKKPYFELARKFALEHKQALQEHPELTYAPSKKKGPKTGAAHPEPQKPGVQQQPQHHQGKGTHHALSGSQQNQPSFATTPDPSPRSTTPRQILPPQNPMFPFQSPLSSGMQIAQVLGQVRPGTQLINNPSAWQASGVQATPPATPVSGSLLVPSQQSSGAFVQPQQLQQRLVGNPLGMQQLAGAVPRGMAATPGQMLDLYYTSLCQPAFPTITESPVNTFSMYPPSYLLEQYNQHFHQQQQQQSGGAGGNNTAGGHF